MMNEDLMSELSIAHKSSSMITVMGVGGAGGNAVNHMWDMGIEGVDFMVCNTDQQALDISNVENKIRLGREGLGAGNDPEEGRRAAVETLEEIRGRLEALNTRMLFITAGMGGGTGTGASPVLAKMAKEMGILTVGIITSPLLVEGNIRYNQAMKGIDELRANVDSLLVLNNENILELYGRLPLKMAFYKADDILCSAAKGIAEIITVKSDFINVDFADVSKVMRGSGRAHMSVEAATGENRAEIVAQRSLNSPLLDHNHISGAKNILLNFSVAKAEDLVLDEVTQVMKFIQSHASTVDGNGVTYNANIIWGTSEKPSLGDALELVLVATGFDDEETEEEHFISAASATAMPSRSGMGGRSGAVPSRGGNSLEPRGVRGSGDLEPFKPATTTPSQSPTTLTPNRQVILTERNSRYADIEQLLEKPAYKSLNARFIADPQTNTKRTKLKEEAEQEARRKAEDSRLFD